MARIEKTVFISYRRKDISWALAVYQYLTRYDYDVFFDYTSISSGDFEQIILSNIKARAHFLVILTPTALDRCSEPGDWLRHEIEVALNEKRNIVPLFFDDFSFSSPLVAKSLTGKLGRIKRYNGLEVPPAYFDEAMNRLCNKYLSITLEAVLHPTSDEVREVVKEQQIAANEAISRKKEKAGKSKEEFGLAMPQKILRSKKIEHAAWLEVISTRIFELGPEGQNAAKFMWKRNTKLGFKRAEPNIGAFWTTSGNIFLNEYYYSRENTLDDLRILTLIIHEVRHLQQGFFTALSVYGELDAWQLEFRLYNRLKGYYPGSGKAIEYLMALPLGWDRNVLREATRLMQDYAGKGYRVDLLPLYPLGKEINYRLFGEAPKAL